MDDRVSVVGESWAGDNGLRVTVTAFNWASGAPEHPLWNPLLSMSPAMLFVTLLGGHVYRALKGAFNDVVHVVATSLMRPVLCHSPIHGVMSNNRLID